MLTGIGLRVGKKAESKFICDVFRVRQEIVGQTEWIFPGKGKTRHLVEMKRFAHHISETSGVQFTLHDLSRVCRQGFWTHKR